MADTPLTVVGAGVVGLAVAARLAPRHPETVILERRERHGMETSSRNSEVIHAGLYYPPSPLKARLCVRGHGLLYARCARMAIAHAKLTKLIVAVVPGEDGELERLEGLARANGVPTRRASSEECRRLEPVVPALGGLFSPTTGIISAHGLMDSLLEEARRHRAWLQARAEVIAIERRDRDYRVTLRS